MKLTTTILSSVALTSAFVIPDEQLTNQIIVESKKQSSFLETIKADADNLWTGVEESFKDAVAFSENAIDNALNAGKKTASSFECYMAGLKFDTQAWLESTTEEVNESIFGGGDHDHPPHHGPPHHGPPHHHKPKHGHKPNETVYQLIAGSKYTTKLAKLINEYPDLVEALNGTAANYTVFAPTDAAFEKIPKHVKKPSAEVIKKILSYHVSTGFYPAGRILVTHTIPTILGEKALGGEPQRLRVNLGLRGLTVNFYSRVVGANFFGTNGVIHAVDSLILPPPPAIKIVELLPGEFSTLQLGLQNTGLFEAIKKADHTGGTLFAPNNWAFKKLGPKINAFLFSKYGEKYLKALLEYHIVVNQTLYSDAFYKQKDNENDVDGTDIPKGHYHVDLPTLLKDKSLSIDVARWGGWITIKINGFNGVAVQDGVAKDGVIHVLSSVLIPPKTPGGAQYDGEGELELEDFKERLLPFIGNDQEL